MQLEAGQVFGRYQIEGVLGEGGMGRVYRAADTTLLRRVALKILSAAEDVDGAALVVAATAFIAISCSETSTETNPDQPVGNLPACSARAPAIEGATFPREALPTGDCAGAGERCAMKIGYACAGGGIGRIDQAQCTCGEGKWTCALTNAGTSTCPTLPGDASTD